MTGSRVLLLALAVVALPSLQLSAAGSPPSESVAYEHFSSVRDVSADRTGDIHFSQGCGSFDCEGGFPVGEALSDGTTSRIYRLDERGRTEIFAPSAENGVDWGGVEFAFDCDNTLHVASSNSIPSHLWRVVDGQAILLYTSSDTSFMGFDFDCAGVLGPRGAIYFTDYNGYAAGDSPIYRLAPGSFERTLFATLEETAVWDVAFHDGKAFVTDTAGGRVLELARDGSTSVAFERDGGTSLTSVAFNRHGDTYFAYVNQFQVRAKGEPEPLFEGLATGAGTIAAGTPAAWQLAPTLWAPGGCTGSYPPGYSLAGGLVSDCWSFNLAEPTRVIAHSRAQSSAMSLVANHARLDVWQQQDNNAYRRIATLTQGDSELSLVPIHSPVASGRFTLTLTSDQGVGIDYAIQVVRLPVT